MNLRDMLIDGAPADSTAADLPPPQWQAVEAAARAFGARFEGRYQLRHFDYLQPVRLQPGVPARLRKPYTTPVAYTDWGPPGAPLVVCCGGVANSAMRFHFLADVLAQGFRVVCMDWLGRGLSGWLADGSEYTRATYVEQLRQLLRHLQAGPVRLLGSSMGGSVAIEYAAAHPRQVHRLVLNDVGPAIPRARRRRRAETLARFYVFRTPDELLRRVGAAHKHDGPISDGMRLFLAYHQTRWSAENRGRVYRHDPRALLAYQRDAQHSLDQWAQWSRIACPVLLVHGMESDALPARTIARMQRTQAVTVAHVPRTGHAPVLSEPSQTAWILHWLTQPAPDPTQLSIP